MQAWQRGSGRGSAGKEEVSWGLWSGALREGRARRPRLNGSIPAQSAHASSHPRAAGPIALLRRVLIRETNPSSYFTVESWFSDVLWVYWKRIGGCKNLNIIISAHAHVHPELWVVVGGVQRCPTGLYGDHNFASTLLFRADDVCIGLVPPARIAPEFRGRPIEVDRVERGRKGNAQNHKPWQHSQNRVSFLFLEKLSNSYAPGKDAYQEKISWQKESAVRRDI